MCVSGIGYMAQSKTKITPNSQYSKLKMLYYSKCIIEQHTHTERHITEKVKIFLKRLNGVFSSGIISIKCFFSAL